MILTLPGPGDDLLGKPRASGDDPHLILPEGITAT